MPISWKLLILAPLCYPPAHPESYANAKLALAMLQAGWRVDVISLDLGDRYWYPAVRDPWKELAPTCT